MTVTRSRHFYQALTQTSISCCRPRGAALPSSVGLVCPLQNDGAGSDPSSERPDQNLHTWVPRSRAPDWSTAHGSGPELSASHLILTRPWN